MWPSMKSVQSSWRSTSQKSAARCSDNTANCPNTSYMAAKPSRCYDLDRRATSVEFYTPARKFQTTLGCTTVSSVVYWTECGQIVRFATKPCHKFCVSSQNHWGMAFNDKFVIYVKFRVMSRCVIKCNTDVGQPLWPCPPMSQKRRFGRPKFAKIHLYFCGATTLLLGR